MKKYNTQKKVTPLSSPEEVVHHDPHHPKIDKSKAKTLRIIAIFSWVIAIGLEIFGIYKMVKSGAEKIDNTLMIIIGIMLILTIIGSVLWKKANRLDPASRKEKWRFFIQNQLGLIISIIAFLPFIIFIFTNKNLTGKEKKWVGGLAIIALGIAGVVGTDFNPPALEDYPEATRQVEELNHGVNHVFWTPSGKSYHLFESCSYINTDRTQEIFAGTVAQAKHEKNIADLCDLCERNALKQNTKE